jgi:acyl CoA:acetate/3-ketoacid CoA transferase beta subunit
MTNLHELAPGVTVEAVRAATAAALIVCDPVGEMTLA